MKIDDIEDRLLKCHSVFERLGLGVVSKTLINLVHVARAAKEHLELCSGGDYNKYTSLKRALEELEKDD